jgi:sugar lactone lactonase YvrE/thiol-disulfide isomerase/thioredoxin
MKDGKVGAPGFVDDHAFLMAALIDLYETTGELEWIGHAEHLAGQIVALFDDPDGGGLFFAGVDGESLVNRGKRAMGSAEPSGIAVAALSFQRLGTLVSNDALGAHAERWLLALSGIHGRAPQALPLAAVGVAWRRGSVRSIAIAQRADLLAAVHSRFLPLSVVAHFDSPPDALPWTAGKATPAAYVCEGFICKLPVTTVADLTAQLDEAAAPARAAVIGAGRVRAPALPASPTAWLNTPAPLTLDRLVGNIVVLDFWTYCCINCLHILPELAAVERAFAGQPVVVIGVHSAKFPAEKEAENVAMAVDRHGIQHPVVLDPGHDLWQQYAVRSWPTVAVVDTRGRIAWNEPGEVRRETLIGVVQRLLDEARDGGTLGEAVWTQPERVQEQGGLSHPGKVHVAGDRLYVADTAHHQVRSYALQTGDDGWPTATPDRVYGTGERGFDAHTLSEPQGMAQAGDVLWVADTGNHAVRRVHLDTGVIETVAGTGELGRGGALNPDRPRDTALRSPWDVLVHDEVVFIAMAGTHQIWVYIPADDRVGPTIGSGREDHVDGSPREAALAQPSGLALSGSVLFWADSEVSSIRAFDFSSSQVGTLVGKGLFDFGDVDGPAEEVLLQHPLGVEARGNDVWVADTFNGKIKHVSLADGTTTTVAAGLAEPGGIALYGDALIVADTGNHRVVAIRAGEVRPLVGSAL